jgi:leader peptidase (prepilin peptidase) / N-methyltransferase
MMIDPTGEASESADDLRPNPTVLLGGAAAIGIISALTLPLPVAIASTVLGTVMVAGADIDARTFLLPDLITWGALACGILVTGLLNADGPWAAAGESIARAGWLAVMLALFRSFYALIRRNEGLGLGDVKLAAAIGAWLPVEVIPLCFGLATTSALIAVTLAHFKGESVTQTTRIPLGAFLCPSLWIAFYVESVAR